jgi:hypothetical protein
LRDVRDAEFHVLLVALMRAHAGMRDMLGVIWEGG